VAERCPECGAPVPESGSCRDNFHSLLALEWQVPDGAGTIAHFFTVASYGLQHPDSMSYTVETIAWLKSAVTEALEMGCSVESLRTSAKAQGEGAYVTRREGDPIPSWGVEHWATTVTDILAGGTEDYGQRVRDWAASVVCDIDAAPEA
jgi:hypothetical protein